MTSEKEKKPCKFCTRKFDPKGVASHEKYCPKNPENMDRSRTTRKIKPQSEKEETKKIKNEGDTLDVSFGRVVGRDTKKIRDFFISHPDEPFTPKQLSFFTKISHSHAKKICQRFFEKGYIEQPYINHYQYRRKITAEELKIIQNTQNMKLHNIMLTVGDSSGDRKGVTPDRGTLDKNLKPSRKFTVKDANVKIFQYPRKAVIYIECSDNPLDIADFNRVIGQIEGRGYDLKEAEIRRIEVNVDVPDLKISGTKSLELRTFSKAWQRLYNKDSRLREEVIIRGAEIPLEEAVAALRGRQALGTNTLVRVVEELKQEAKLSNLSTRHLHQLVGNLLRRLDRLESTIDPKQRKLNK